MVYIYDILVNFIDGEEVYEFFEWESKDIIEHIKKIPVVKVDNKTFYDFLFNEVLIDYEFLNSIKGKTATYKDKIDYACLITNDERCYALEFNKEGEILFKSSLLLDEEDDVVSCSNKIDITDIKYKIVNKNKAYERIETRKEAREINLLKRDIMATYKYKDYEKLTYLYNEAYGDDELSIKEKYDRLMNDLDINFTNGLKKLVKIIMLANKK